MHYNKVKAGLSLTQECQNMLEENKNIDGSGSKNELAENAIRFYIAYQHSENHRDYLTKTLTQGASAAIKDTEDRIARLAYKIAVEMAMSNLILLDLLQASDLDIQKYCRKAVEILKQSKGFLTLDQAHRFKSQEVYDGVKSVLKNTFVYADDSDDDDY